MTFATVLGCCDPPGDCRSDPGPSVGRGGGVLDFEASAKEQLKIGRGQPRHEKSAVWTAHPKREKMGFEAGAMSHTILSVDDNEAIRFIRAKILREAGYEIVEGASATECLKLASERHPDLILLDIRLPDGNGFATCKRLKADPQTASIPVLHISSMGKMEHDYPEALESGAEAYLREPVEPSLLVASITALIRASEAEGREREAREDARAARIEAEETRAQMSEQRSRMSGSDVKELTKRIKELEESNLELQQFASIVSHDLQAPLNTVETFTKWLSEQYSGKLDSEAKKYLHFIGTAAKRMKIFVHGLLEYSRAEAASNRSYLQADCNETVARTLMLLQADLNEGNVIVTSDPLPTITANERQLEQVFQNLISNAIKYRSREKTPTVHISAIAQGGEWRFSVQDNGIGIDPAQSERIFKLFERLHPPSDSNGAGIGLAICKRIVERHGGRVWVESEPGKGSTFFFTIPMQAADRKL